jgi:chromosome partitioning protein
MIVAITNLKGGVGKTTTALALASAASSAGEKVKVVDADSQGSATLWGISAEENGDPLPFEIVPGNQATVPRIKGDGEWVFIDCPPSGKVTDEAVNVADFVVVPMTPSAVDMQQTWATVQTLSTASKLYAVLICRADPRTLTYRAAIEALREADASFFDTSIPQREDIKNCFGSPFDRDLYGYDAVFEEIKEAF